MSEWFLFVIICLSAASITRYLTVDTMPFAPLRDRLQERWEDTIFSEGLTCPYCIGSWVSFALVAAVAQIVSIPLPGLYALAVRIVAGKLVQLTED